MERNASHSSMAGARSVADQVNCATDPPWSVSPALGAEICVACAAAAPRNTIAIARRAMGGGIITQAARLQPQRRMRRGPLLIALFAISAHAQQWSHDVDGALFATSVNQTGP